MKKANKQQVNNQQVNNNGCQHVQLGGVAFYDEGKCFMFSPENEGVRNKVEGFRSQGIAQQLTDGTFDFMAKPRIRSQAKLIRKLAHGRVSKTKGWGYPAHPEGVLRRGNQYCQYSREGGRRGC